MKITLGEVGTYINGYAFKPSDWGTSGLPIIRIQNLTNQNTEPNYFDGPYNSKFEVNKGDILIAWSGSLGIHIWQKNKALLNQHIFRVEFNKCDIDKMYFYYAVKYNIHKMLHLTHGATMRHIIKSDFEQIIIPYPSLEAQAKISKVLNYLDQNIINYRNILINLELLIKSRFDEFNKNNDDVKVLKLEAICTSIVRGPFGSALKVENFVKKSDTSVKVYEQSNAIQRSAAIGSRYISREHYKSLRRFKCKPGDIIMSCSGTIGKLFILPNDAEEGIINQALCKFTLGKDLLPEVFLLYMDILIGNIETKGSGIKNISAVKFIKNLEIPVPPIEAQNKLLIELNQINKLKSDVEKSIDETQLLMDSLMQEYFG